MSARIPNEPATRQKPPSKVKGAVYRVRGIPLDTEVQQLHNALLKEFHTEETKFTIDTYNGRSELCYSDDRTTKTALIQFLPQAPQILNDDIARDGRYPVNLDNGHRVVLDLDFYGLTQLYPTRGEIKADIVVVCGLNGHAYGSWAGKADRQGRRVMWLRDFLSEDFPQCRTMIYGYNSKLRDQTIHEIPDYTDSFLETIKNARESQEEARRPIVLIGHSFGGIIISHAIVKAAENPGMYDDLSSSIHATIFYGTPHRGLVIDDMRAMIGKNSPKGELVDSIKVDSRGLEAELKRFINCAGRMKLMIVSYKESGQTRKLIQGPDGVWFRGGDYFAAVEKGSSILQLPSTLEYSLGIEGDHSTMVKFEVKQDQAYKSVAKQLSKFTSGNHQPPTSAVQQSFNHQPSTGAVHQPSNPGSNNAAETNPITAYNAVISKNAQALDQALRSQQVNLEEILTHGGKKTTLLILAIENKDPASVSILIQHGANYRAMANNFTALHYAAAILGYVSVAEAILNSNVDIEMKGVKGLTALHLASHHGQVKSVEMLLNRGAKMNATHSGNTALIYAAQNGHYKVARVLLSRGANIAARNSNQYNALQLAALNGHAKFVRELLSYGADTTATVGGYTALQLAHVKGHGSVVALLTPQYRAW